LLDLPVATPLTETETLAALKSIADSPHANLPAVAESGEAPLPGSVIEERGESEESESARVAEEPPAGWKTRGLDPRAVNPGDIVAERRGPYLKKVMSILDDLPTNERNPLLKEFSDSSKARIPVTLSRTELADLARQIPPDISLPTRSVALDIRRETHTLDPRRFDPLLVQIASGNGAKVIRSPDRLARLEKQIGEVKRRLAKGEKLHLITSVGESSVVHATYPGAPVGKRDAELIRNAVAMFYPHSGKLTAEKTSAGIELTGSPQIVWEYETRELRLEGDRVAVGPAPLTVR